MVHPLRVDYAQHDYALYLGKINGRARFFAKLFGVLDFSVVISLDRLVKLVLDFLKRPFLHALLSEKIGVVGQKLTLDFLIEVFIIPLVPVDVGVGKVIDDYVHLVAHHLENLVVRVDAVKHLVALAVDNGTLGVHYVVVFQHLAAHRVVSALDVALGVFNLTGQHTHGKRSILVYPEHFGNAFHSVAAEKTHKFVLHGQIEDRRTDIALTACSSSQLIVDTAGLVTLGADDAQSAPGNDFFFFLIDFCFIFVVEFPELLARFQNFGVVGIVVRGSRGNGLLAHADVAHTFYRHVFGIAAQHDVGTAAGHVGSDGNGAEFTRLSDYFRFLFMVFGVQHVVRNLGLVQHTRKLFALFDGGGAHKHGLSALIAFGNVRHYRAQFSRDGGINLVVFVHALGRKVGGYSNDVQIVNPAELRFLRFGGTRHAAELFVKTEIILERDGGKSLVFALNADVLLCLDCLVQSVAVTAPVHKSSGKLVHDYDFVFVVDDIVLVKFHYIIGADCVVYIMVKLHVFDVGKIVHRKETLGFFHAAFGKSNRFLLFVDVEVVGLKAFGKTVGGDVHFAAFAAAARYDKRGTRLVDENGVHLVDYTEVERALDLVLLVNDHVVPEVIEAQLVVGGVSNIAIICGALGVAVHARNGDAHGKAQKPVHFSHPFGVTFCKIIVYGNHVHAFTGKRVEVACKRSDQRFAFAGAHLSYSALMKSDTAHKLNVEMAHTQHSGACLPDRRKSLGQNVVKRFVVVLQSVAEFRRLCFKLLVA